MRTIKFEKDQLTILTEIFSLGNSQYTNDFPEISKLILNKIRIEIFHFSKKEIQILKSYTSNWLNNNEELIDVLREKYLDKKNINYLTISELEEEKMLKISIVFSIKSKLFLESYITFKKVLEKA